MTKKGLVLLALTAVLIHIAASNPACVNGENKLFIDGKDTGRCACGNGFSGETCEIAEALKCQNCGNLQHDGILEYCSCVNGWYGYRCHFCSAAELSETMCKNGGTRVNGYGRCACKNGFRGDTCEIEEALTCGTDGIMQYYGTARYEYCTCNKDRFGYACQYTCGLHVAEKCQASAHMCANGGTRIYGIGSKADGRCACVNGYSGDTCELTEALKCQNSGNLQYYAGTYEYCSCVNNWYGYKCHLCSVAGQCTVKPRVDCGYHTISPAICIGRGCCYDGNIPNAPWCYFC